MPKRRGAKQSKVAVEKTLLSEVLNLVVTFQDDAAVDATQTEKAMPSPAKDGKPRQAKARKKFWLDDVASLFLTVMKSACASRGIDADLVLFFQCCT